MKFRVNKVTSKGSVITKWSEAIGITTERLREIEKFTQEAANESPTYPQALVKVAEQCKTIEEFGTACFHFGVEVGQMKERGNGGGGNTSVEEITKRLLS